MEFMHRLLAIQNQSWFYTYKSFFCQCLEREQNLSEVFEKAYAEFPELRRRVEFPLDPPPQMPFSYQCVLYGSPDFPQSFYQMEDPPLVLTVAGHMCWKNEKGLSVVGSREPAPESLQWINEELGNFVEHRRPILISGGARGVDQAVHALAIRKKLPTIVFLPSGLGKIYPSALETWLPQVINGGGCFISEYSLYQRIERSLFHHRNRLIAQLGLATLIVQASERSGTLMTGHLAMESNRPCWVVPGHPLRQVFRGNLQLLREGGTVVSNANDLSLFFSGEEGILNQSSVYVDVNIQALN